MQVVVSQSRSSLVPYPQLLHCPPGHLPGPVLKGRTSQLVNNASFDRQVVDAAAGRSPDPRPAGWHEWRGGT